MDARSFAGTSFCVAPFICILDQAIVQNAAGTQTLSSSVKQSLSTLVTKPTVFFRSPSFLLLWGVYGGTYLAVNVSTTLCDHWRATPEQRHAVKFFGVSSVNLGLNVSKDRVFAKLFGSGSVAAPHSVPYKSLAAFGLRDSLTVFSSFNLTPLVAEALPCGGASRAIAQLSCPVLMQWFSAPIHLLGLNWYNVPTATTTERWRSIRRNYLSTALARCGRILPAFGVAPLINAPLREWTRATLGPSAPSLPYAHSDRATAGM